MSRFATNNDADGFRGLIARAHGVSMTLLTVLLLTACGRTTTTPVNSWTLAGFRDALVRDELVLPALDGTVDVPFALLGDGVARATIALDSRTGHSQLRLDDGRQLAFERPGLPLALHALRGQRHAVVYRERPSDALQIVRWDGNDGSQRVTTIEPSSTRPLLLRASAASADGVTLLLYDVAAQTHLLAEYRDAEVDTQHGLQIRPLQIPGRIGVPSNRVALFADKDIRIVGGDGELRIESDKLTTTAFSDCDRVIEAVRSRSGTTALCRATAASDDAYFLIETAGTRTVRKSVRPGVPWKLRWDAPQMRLEYSSATHTRDFAAALERDLDRAHDAGMFASLASVGATTTHVRYLESLLDAIQLARHDDHAFELLVPLIHRLRLRLELELRLLESSAQTTAQTIDAPARSRAGAASACDISRLLARYRHELHDAAAFPTLERSSCTEAPHAPTTFVSRPPADQAVALRGARSGATEDIPNQIWNIAMLRAGSEDEDMHSHALHDAALARLPSLPRLALGSASSEQALLEYLRVALPFNTGQMLRHAGSELGGKYAAWHLAYDLRATLIAYERSNRPEFLRLFETAADKVLAVRDDRLGIVDGIRKRPAKSWGSNRYSADKETWVAWDAFAGMVTYPLARYAVLTCGSSQPQTTRCETYRIAAEEALAEYASYWTADPESGGGYYIDPYLEEVAPLNHMNTLGLVHLELWKLTGDEVHRERTTQLAQFFRHHWKPNRDGTVEWEYWAGAKRGKNRSTEPEDVTHAQINMHFAYECHAAGIGFSDADMAVLARTLMTRVVRDRGDWAATIGGNGKLVAELLHEGLSGWIVLEEFDARIRGHVDEFVRGRPQAFPLGHFSYATGPIAVAHTMPRGAPGDSR